MLAQIRFEPVTNREDLVLQIGIADDDTGDGINLSGTTLAPGFTSSGFTGAVWTVSAGSVLTSSVTSLTIPATPIGDDLLAVTLTVGTGLSISAGTTITISDTPTGLNTMSGYVTSYNSTTGVLVCQIGYSFQFEIRAGRPADPGTGYVTWFDFGVQNDRGPLLSASLGDGILISDVGILDITIPESQMRQLCQGGTYKAALTLTDTVNTRQVFLAELPVLWGGVTN